ncbi:hypothetical protein PEL8287_02572 [Roseovarius litorisediminis]|uniref:Anti-sigma factor n=1 Tax=Roseovarius litorisediminis TaxID=1312363 RepID=A0A1Y5SVJ8_9RHOB|nr:hypothetical protein [Roseovarius litorisediminis]SLN49334.1 hypothetical protein PEL8287_02572 [Roseovarius litorisediminis]
MSENANQLVSDEMLMAHADGELSDHDTKALDARIARDPDLQARHAVFVATSEALRTALSPGPVPKRLIQAVQNSDIKSGKARTPPLKASFWPVALAATLVVGVGLGWAFQAAMKKGALTGLAEAERVTGTVQTGNSLDLADGARLRAIGTFETARGLCRLMLLAPSSTTKTRFVACRTNTDWQVAFSVSESSEDVFAPASAGSDELIDSFLDSINASPALSFEEERELLLEIKVK